MKRKFLFFAAICFCFAFVFNVDAQQRKSKRRTAAKSDGLVLTGDTVTTVDKRGRVVTRKRKFAYALGGINEKGQMELIPVEPEKRRGPKKSHRLIKKRPRN